MHHHQSVALTGSHAGSSLHQIGASPQTPCPARASRSARGVFFVIFTLILLFFPPLLIVLFTGDHERHIPASALEALDSIFRDLPPRRRGGASNSQHTTLLTPPIGKDASC